MTDAQGFTRARQVFQQRVDENDEDSRGGCSSLDDTSEKSDDRTFGVVRVHARRCPSVDDLQQVDIGNVICTHHCPQRGLAHRIKSILEVNVNSDYPLP